MPTAGPLGVAGVVEVIDTFTDPTAGIICRMNKGSEYEHSPAVKCSNLTMNRCAVPTYRDVRRGCRNLYACVIWRRATQGGSEGVTELGAPGRVLGCRGNQHAQTVCSTSVSAKHTLCCFALLWNKMYPLTIVPYSQVKLAGGAD